MAVVILGLGALAMIAPFLWMFATSLRAATHAYDLPPTWIPTSFRWSNYSQALTGPVPLLRTAANSLIVATVVTISQVLTCSMAGYAFARLRFPFRNGLLLLLLASLMVPVQATIIPLFGLMRHLGLLDSLPSLILPNLTGAVGVFMMRQFFLTLPQELFEAARVDGAREWTLFSRIALPLAKPAVSALAVIVFLLSWNNFFMPLVFINSIQRATLPLALVLMLGPYKAGNPAVVMAATTLAILPVLTLFLIAQRWLVDTMARSGVKG